MRTDHETRDEAGAAAFERDRALDNHNPHADYEPEPATRPPLGHDTYPTDDTYAAFRARLDAEADARYEETRHA